MCGIIALIEPERRFDDRLLQALGDDMAHRGPDAAGVASEPGVALVFRRLSILDPTPRSDQPMSDASGKVTLIFNGEIYNFRDLRRELEEAGAAFRTSGDTEVIVQGYLRWGEGVFDRLEGMYAIVIHDRRDNCVLAARDPYGIKPLYMLRKGALTAFASEVAPFARLVPLEPDPDALAELLIFGWAAGALSNFRNVERVQGGTLLRIGLADGAISRRRFCDPLEILEQPDLRLSQAEAEELAHDAVRASVEAHLASDVGYTVQLSGGVDSSLITAMASSIAGEKLVTFGITLEDKRHDESEWRDMVAADYAIDHREIPLSARQFAEAFPRALRHMDGPSPHMGCVLLMLLCDEIAKVSKVVLTGEGADEFFGGYLRYGEWRKWEKQEKWGRRLPTALLPNRPPFLGVRRLGGRDATHYASVYHDFPATQRIFPALAPGSGERGAVSGRFRDFRDRLFAVDQTAYLESLLVRQDKMAMAASVEARVPFVHLPLGKALNRLPHDIRVPGGVTKPLLKKVGERYLPRDLLYRRKVGLTLPFADWLRQEDGLGRYLDDLTAPDARLAPFADRRRLHALVEGFRAGQPADVPALVRLVNIETWLRGLPGAPAASASAA